MEKEYQAKISDRFEGHLKPPIKHCSFCKEAYNLKQQEYKTTEQVGICITSALQKCIYHRDQQDNR